MASHTAKPATAATVNRLQGEVASKHDAPPLSQPSRQVQPVPTFVVHLRAVPGRDPIHSLRLLLKYALRQCGMRAVEVREETAP